MPLKEREILFKINEQVIKASQPPQTTNTPLTGEVPTEQPFSSPVAPIPLPPLPQLQG